MKKAAGKKAARKAGGRKKKAASMPMPEMPENGSGESMS